jgi:hypothetical protein
MAHERGNRRHDGLCGGAAVQSGDGESDRE